MALFHPLLPSRLCIMCKKTLLPAFYFCSMLVFFLLSSCASHYQHYTAFTASDSHGVVRVHRLTWESYQYPAWHWRSDRATPIHLESQCSDRIWVFRDSSMRDERLNKLCQDQLIAACGDPDRDLSQEREALRGGGEACMTLTDSSGSHRIIDLDSRISLSVRCYPAGSDNGGGHYPRASVVPYQLSIRRAPAGSRDWHPPVLNQSSCQ